jgi:two-component system, chemotaxis family, sensor kinase CheA
MPSANVRQQRAPSRKAVYHCTTMATMPFSDRPRSLRVVPPPGHFVSLATKIAAITVVVVTVVCALVVLELSRRERERVIDAKETAAAMVADLFVETIVPSLDYRDQQGIVYDVETLRSTRDIIYAAVWLSDSLQPAAEYRAPRAPVFALDRPPAKAANRRAERHIDLVRPVKSATGADIGTALIRVSLDHENEAFAWSRKRIVGYSFLVAGLVAALLVAGVRRTVVEPLARLSNAARRVAAGERIEVPVTAADEVGQLSSVFNAMGKAIDDRETRLAAATGRLQALLDHMGQAIVVFGDGGVIRKERSRLTEEIFGSAARPGKNVLDLLYPEGRSTAVEREAFGRWLSAVFASGERGWDAWADLAPNAVTVNDGGPDEVVLELAFRPVPEEAGVAVMMLATDVTARHRLQRSAEQKEREHQKQIRAMRRLLEGGGQVFVRFLENADGRMKRCDKILRPPGRLDPAAIKELFENVHTLRAEARCFDLAAIETELESMEARLSHLRAPGAADDAEEAQLRGAISASILAISRLLKEAEGFFVEGSPIGRLILDQITVRRTDVLRLYELVGARNDEIAAVAGRLASRPFGESLMMLAESVPRWAERIGKRAQIEVDGKETLVPPALLRVLEGALSHLIRNAIAHGVETAEQRQLAGKSPVGRISVTCSDSPKGPVISVRDDGAGFDLIALSESARARGIDAKAGTLLEIAVLPGVSTHEDHGDIAGRGVGLGAVKADLEKVGYTLELSSSPGSGSIVTMRSGRSVGREVSRG